MKLILISLLLLTSCAEQVKYRDIVIHITQPVVEQPKVSIAPAPYMGNDDYDDYDWTEIDQEIDEDHKLKVSSYDPPRADIETEVPFETKQEEFEGVE